MIQRENPAAAVAPANWVLGCPKVLRHQRSFPLLFLDCCSELRMVLILAVWSVTIFFFEYIDLLVSLLHFFFGIVDVIIENPRHPMLSLYLRSSQNWLRFFVPTISIPPVQTSNLCLLPLQRAAFASPLSSCSGEVPYILPRVGHFTRMKAAVVNRSHLCFILRCICSSINGLGLA